MSINANLFRKEFLNSFFNYSSSANQYKESFQRLNFIDANITEILNRNFIKTEYIFYDLFNLLNDNNFVVINIVLPQEYRELVKIRIYSQILRLINRINNSNLVFKVNFLFSSKYDLYSTCLDLFEFCLQKNIELKTIYLLMLEDLMDLEILSGFQVLIAGRLNKADKRSHMLFQSGSLKFSTIHKKLFVCNRPVLTPEGIINITVWFAFK